MKVLANCGQGLDEGQKLQARTNIGAIGGVKVFDGSTTEQLTPDADGNVTVDLSDAGKVQSDWNETNNNEPSYIRNKPNLATVATSGSYNDLTDKPSIPAAQVQSDWTQSDTTAVDYIKNKPTALETKPLVAGTHIEFNSTAQQVTINSTATKVVKRPAPYSVDTPVSEMVVYNPGEGYGAIVRDQDDNTLGYFAPKHYGDADLGKVLTIVDDNGYKMEWRKLHAWTHIGTVDSDAGVNPAMRILLEGQSSGAVLASKMLRNAITLEAGKKYLFLPNRFCGNAFYTKTVDENSTKNWQLRVVLADADSYSYAKHPIIACGAFSVFNFVADGNQDVPATGEKMSAGLSPESAVFTPAEDITLDRYLLVPNGNIIGCGIPSAQNSVLYVNCFMTEAFDVYEI